MSKVVSLDQKFKSLTGAEGQMSLGQIVGDALYSQAAFPDWEKSNQIAKDLFDGKEVELGDEEFQMLVNFVQAYGFSGGVKEQILAVLKEK